MTNTSGDHPNYYYGSIPATDRHNFYEDSHNLQSSPEPYCSQITCHITINLSEEGARNPSELPPTMQRNSETNVEGARGDEWNK